MYSCQRYASLSSEQLNKNKLYTVKLIMTALWSFIVRSCTKYIMHDKLRKSSYQYFKIVAIKLIIDVFFALHTPISCKKTGCVWHQQHCTPSTDLEVAVIRETAHSSESLDHVADLTAVAGRASCCAMPSVYL